MGKRTTTRHKETNTFRFQSFEERILGIDIGIISNFRTDYASGRLDEGEADQKPYLLRALESLSDLNLSNSFNELVSEIGNDVRTLPQIFLSKNRIAEVLLKHFDEADKFSLPSTFEIIASFSFDLQKDFDSFRLQFLTKIISTVLIWREIEVIEEGFRCALYLLKHSSVTHLKSEIGNYYALFSSLFGEKKAHYLKLFGSRLFEQLFKSRLQSAKNEGEREKSFILLLEELLLHDISPLGLGLILCSFLRGARGGLKFQALNYLQIYSGLGTKSEKLGIGSFVEVFSTWSEPLRHMISSLVDNIQVGALSKIAHYLLDNITAENGDFNEFDELMFQNLVLCSYKNPPYRKCLLDELNKRSTLCSRSKNLEDVSKIINSLCESATNLNDSPLAQLHAFFTHSFNNTQLCMSIILNIYHLPGFFNEFSGEKYGKNLDFKRILPKLILKNLGKSGDKCNYTNGMIPKIYGLRGRNLLDLGERVRRNDFANCCNLMAKIEECENKLEITNSVLLIGFCQPQDTCSSCISQIAKLLKTFSISNCELKWILSSALANFYDFKPDIFTPSSTQIVQLLIECYKNLLSKLYETLDESSTYEKQTHIIWTLKSIDELSSILFGLGIDIQNEIPEVELMLTGQFLSSDFVLQMERGIGISILSQFYKGLEEKELFYHMGEIEKISSLALEYSSSLNSHLTPLTYKQLSPQLTSIVVNYGYGLLRKSYVPIWKPCINLIKSCLNSRGEFCAIGSSLIGHFLKKDDEEEEEVLNGQNNDLSYEEQIQVVRIPPDCLSVGKISERTDEKSYIRNIWLTLANFYTTPSCSKETSQLILQQAAYFINNACQKPPYFGLNRSPDKLHQRILPSLDICAEVLVRGSRALHKNLSQDSVDDLKKLLSSDDKKISGVAFEMLAIINPQLEPYSEVILQLINLPKFPFLADFNLEAQSPIIKNEKDREVVMDVVLRILAQKFTCSKQPVRTPILIALKGFKEEEVKTFINFVIGEWDLWKNLEGEAQLRPSDLSCKNLQKRIGFIRSMIQSWEYAFPHLVLLLLSYIFIIISLFKTLKKDEINELTNEINEENSEETEKVSKKITKGENFEEKIESSEENDEKMEVRDSGDENIEKIDEESEGDGDKNCQNETVFNSEIKALCNEAFLVVECIFTKIPRVVISNELMSCVFSEIIEPRVVSLAQNSTGGTGGTHRLLNLWAKSPRSIKYLFRKIRGDETCLDSLLSLLPLPTVHESAKIFVLKIFTQLAWDSAYQIAEDEETKLYYPPHEDASAYNFTTISENEPFYTHLSHPALNLNLNAILHSPSTLLRSRAYIANFGPILKNGVECSKYLKLLRLLITHSTACGLELSSYSPSNFCFECKLNESRGEYFELLREIVLKIKDSTPYFLVLSKYFRTEEDIKLRGVLLSTCEGLGDKELKNCLFRLNAWSEKELDCPDYDKRVEGVKIAKTLCEQEFSVLRAFLIGQNLMYFIKNENQGVSVHAVLEIFSHLARNLSKNGQTEHREEVRRFLSQVILFPTLKTLVKHKTFESRLKILRILSLECSEFSPSLKALKELTNENEEVDILVELTDIKYGTRIKGMNRLLKLLEDPERRVKFGSNDLIDFIIPLASYCVELAGRGEKKKISQINNLVDSAFKVIRAAVGHLSPKAFISSLEEILSKKPNEGSEMKRYKRHLLAFIDGFNYKSETLFESYNISKSGVEADFKRLIERLSSLIHFSKNEDENKKEDPLKTEYTLSIVRLLNKFPPHFAKSLLSGIVPSLCSTLKSKKHSTRRIAKSTLLRYVSESGVQTLKTVLTYLEANLKLGYQLHVLNNTVYSLLNSSQESLVASPENLPLRPILGLCEREFFGVMSEEKKVGKILEKTREARFPNGENMLRIVGKVVGRVEEVGEMIDTALQKLKLRKTEKWSSVVSKWISCMTRGLVENSSILHEDLFSSLLYPRLLSMKKPNSFNNSKADKGIKRKSTYELEKVPTRGINDTESTERDLFISFSFRLIQNWLGRVRERVELPEEFLAIVASNLDHPVKEIAFLSHQITTSFFRLNIYKVGEDEKFFEMIWRKIMTNVNKFSLSVDQSSVDENMTTIIFNCITAFLAFHKTFKMKIKDFSVLIASIQNFVTNGQCSSAMLSLLNQIFTMKVNSAHIEELMDFVLKESVRNTTPHVSAACRKAYVHYIYNGKVLKNEDFVRLVEKMLVESTKASLPHETVSIVETILALIREEERILDSLAHNSLGRSLLLASIFFMHRDEGKVRDVGRELLKALLKVKEKLKFFLPILIPMFSTDKYLEGISQWPLLSTLIGILFPPFLSCLNKEVEELLVNMSSWLNFYLVPIENEKDVLIYASTFAIRKIVQDYTGKNEWRGSGVLEKMWKNLIDTTCKLLDTTAGYIKTVVLEILSVILRSSSYTQILDSSFKGPSKESIFLFLESIESYKNILDFHFNALSSFKTQEDINQVAANITFLTQIGISIGNDKNQIETKEKILRFIIKKFRFVMNEAVVKSHDNKDLLLSSCYKSMKYIVCMLDITNCQNLTVFSELHYRNPIPEHLVTPEIKEMLKTMVQLTTRDATNDNIIGGLRGDIEDFSNCLRKRFGGELYDLIEAESRKFLHTKRHKNKMQKSEKKVTNPGLKRKRSKSKKPNAKIQKKRQKCG